MKKGFEWDIEQINDSDYRLILTFYAQNRLMRKIFNTCRKKTEKKKGRIGANLDIIEKFNIADEMKPKMLPLLNRAVIRPIKMVMSETAKDGFKILNYGVLDAIYTKIKGEEFWTIEVIVEGQFAKH